MSTKLGSRDYAFWAISIIVMFLVFEALGNFGNLSVLSSASQVSLYEKQLFKITYIAAGGVFAIFMGSLIFLSLRFREVEQRTQKTQPDYVKVSIPLLLISGIILVFAAYPYFSPYLPLQLQFNIGIIISMSMVLLLAITFVVYKEYFKD
ncbi:hypothetical protein [Stygiolobus caldivivus]|uniref:Uncharacterized protein n=1 Tax=Stygiolobus caldivivus TaxID=2824673 RepID=A0A8D5U5T5_9CREN|nr:hypothetical protein [Stygiolobus caldivivus]BCU69605.1 hypothetical protein KN1_09020 [Stygiolobus caldivivus]